MLPNSNSLNTPKDKSSKLKLTKTCKAISDFKNKNISYYLYKYVAFNYLPTLNK